MGRTKTLQSLLDAIPPFLVAVLPVVRAKSLSVRSKDYRYKARRNNWKSKQYPARNGWRLKSRSQIAADSGLHPKTVYRISRQTSWDRINIGEMFAFWRGCGFEIFSQRHKQRLAEWIQTGMKLDHLLPAEKRRFLKKMKDYQAGRKLISVSSRDRQQAPPLAGTPAGPSI